MAVLVVLLGSVLALLAAVVAGDLSTHGGVRRAMRRPQAPHEHLARPGGAAVREITGVEPDLTPRTIPLVGTPTATLLAFLGSTCVTCDGLWRGADRAARRSRRALRIVIVTRGPEAESPGLVAAKAPRSVPVLMSEAGWAACGVGPAPAFVVVGIDGVPTPLDVPATWGAAVAAARSPR